MERRGLFSLFYLLAMSSVAGQLEDVITQAKVVRALPGTDVTLVCSFPRSDHIYVTQVQWSRIDDNQLTRIAVYHPTYGIQYFKFPETAYNFSVSFSIGNCCSSDAKEASCSPGPNTFPECSQWALQLKNVSVSLSGQYECSLATYPFGTKAGKIQLIVQAEEEQHYVKEVQLNQTLEIPCLGNVTSENLSNYPLKWLVGENGRKEELVTKEPSSPEVYRNDNALYRERIHLGLNNALKIFPTKLSDDGRMFSCHVAYHPERTRKSSTTVRVLAYPEISASLQEGSAGTLQKPNISCVVRKAFPKPSLVWYVDREILRDQSGEMSVKQEDSQDSEDNKSNEVSIQAFSTVASEDLGNSALSSTIMTISENRSVSLAPLDFTSRASLAPATATQGSGKNMKARPFPWPTAVAVLLLLCSFLIVLGIWKWCQYQKEIMNRPPSFKPPPPPIKYTSMVESDGTPPSCHELESL